MRDGPPSTHTAPAAAGQRAPTRLRRLARRARNERRLTACVVVLVSAFAVVLWMRQPIADWLWPDTRIQQLRAEAEAALDAGRLSDPDGRGARELFEAAIALDPDRPEARAGLARVGRAALVEASRATQSGRFDHAHRHLALARALAMPRVQTDAVARRLRQREADVADVDRILALADAALAASQPDIALDYYVRVQKLVPSQTRALEGREDAVAAVLVRAREDIAAGRLDAAASTIDRMQRADAGHVDLAETMAALAQATESARRNGGRDVRSGRLTRALERYDMLLRVDAEDGVAREGRDAVARAHLTRSEGAAADFRFDVARRELDAAAAINPQLAGIVQARSRLDRARRTQATVAGAPASARARRVVNRLLEEADEARGRGDLLTPPGDSAFDKLRAARAIAPNDVRIRDGMRTLQPAARRCFEDHLRANRLIAARVCLDARVAVEGEARTVRDARRRLAQRWIAVGDERLGAGELDRARQALAAARELDAGSPGIEPFAERVRSAGALERD